MHIVPTTESAIPVHIFSRCAFQTCIGFVGGIYKTALHCSKAYTLMHLVWKPWHQSNSVSYYIHIRFSFWLLCDESFLRKRKFICCYDHSFILKHGSTTYVICLIVDIREEFRSLHRSQLMCTYLRIQKKVSALHAINSNEKIVWKIVTVEYILMSTRIL